MVNMKAQGDSYRVINHDFRKAFPFSGRDPSNMTIYRQKKKFDQEGTVHNLNKGRSGRPLSALTPENLQLVDELLESEVDLPARVSRSSARKHRLPIPMTKSSFNRATKKLGYHPYKLLLRHKLNPADIPRRVSMCQHIIQQNDDDPSWLSNLWTSDEANFNLNGVVNSKNVLCYAPKGQGTPENFSIETVKNPDGVMAFGCLRLDGTKLPLKFYYSRWVNGERVSGTLDGDGYYKLLRYNVFPKIKVANNGTFEGQTWQQDGASVHRTRRSLDYIQSSFGSRTLALGSERWGGQAWSPNSPDLAPLDFCIWGVMKHHVFSDPMPNSREELVQKIISVWDTKITEELVKRAAQGLLNRCHKVLASNGSHQTNE